MSSPAAYLLSGLALAEKGDHRGAVALYSRSIELTPTTTAYYNRGTSYLVLGEYMWALEDLDRAIAGYPSVRQARMNRAVALIFEAARRKRYAPSLIGPRNLSVSVPRPHQLRRTFSKFSASAVGTRVLPR